MREIGQVYLENTAEDCNTVSGDEIVQCHSSHFETGKLWKGKHVGGESTLDHIFKVFSVVVAYRGGCLRDTKRVLKAEHSMYEGWSQGDVDC